MAHSEPADSPVAAFIDRIQRMNEIFDIERNTTPKDLGVDRLRKFRKTFTDEVVELNDIVEAALSNEHGPVSSEGEASLVVMVALADFLGDVVVYAFSEARRWGIPLDQVLHAIMDSQDSKLVDGKALKDANNKFLKGPDYAPPEPSIKAILQQAMYAQASPTGRFSSEQPNEANVGKAAIPRFRAGPQPGELIYSGHMVDILVPLVQPSATDAKRCLAVTILEGEIFADHRNAVTRGRVVPESMRMTRPGDVGPRGIVFRCVNQL